MFLERGYYLPLQGLEPSLPSLGCITQDLPRDRYFSLCSTHTYNPCTPRASIGVSEDCKLVPFPDLPCNPSYANGVSDLFVSLQQLCTAFYNSALLAVLLCCVSPHCSILLESSMTTLYCPFNFCLYLLSQRADYLVSSSSSMSTFKQAASLSSTSLRDIENNLKRNYVHLTKGKMFQSFLHKPPI